MEKLKPSEEEIIKLGEKIVKELNLNQGVDTLGRWMSHYLSELIVKSESHEDESIRNSTRKECCDLILKLWENKEDVPGISTPTSDLEPIINILKAFQDSKITLPFWKSYEPRSNKGPWNNFLETVKSNTESIFQYSLYSELNIEILNSKSVWIDEHPDFLTDEEEEFLKQLNNLINYGKLNYKFTNDGKETNLLELSKKERYSKIFDSIENEINEMSEKLIELRKMKQFR